MLLFIVGRCDITVLLTCYMLLFIAAWHAGNNTEEKNVQIRLYFRLSSPALPDYWTTELLARLPPYLLLPPPPSPSERRGTSLMLSGLRTGGNSRYQAIALRIKLEDAMQICIREALLSSVKVKVLSAKVSKV